VPVSRIIVALGGNAIVHGADTGPVGPQVGNLLLKNELARDVVPAVPLHWCVAQTQATIGFLIANALEPSLHRLGLDRRVGVVVTRVVVSADDVKGAALRFGEPDEEWLGKVSGARLREYASQGFFEQGSMAPKVEAALRFVEAGGRTAAIASLAEVVGAAEGRAGTSVDGEV
jgi:carbamate kinase